MDVLAVAVNRIRSAEKQQNSVSKNKQCSRGAIVCTVSRMWERAVVPELRHVCQQLTPAHTTIATACACGSLVTLHRQRDLLDVAHRLRQVDAGGARQVVRRAERRGCSTQGWPVSAGLQIGTTAERSTAVATACSDSGCCGGISDQ